MSLVIESVSYIQIPGDERNEGIEDWGCKTTICLRQGHVFNLPTVLKEWLKQ